MTMKCTVLVENTSLDDNYCSEHGLSFFIETNNHRILFDMGQADLFAENAEKLKIDLSMVDFAVISHGHYDHGGGLEKFLQLNHHAPVYLHETAFLPAYHGKDKYIGLDSALKNHPQIHLISNEVIIDEKIRIVPCSLKKAEDTSLTDLSVLKNGNLVPDSFEHEISLLIHEEKLVCFSGCSHKGVKNYMNWFHPDVLIGGFHLKKLNSDNDEIRKLAFELLKYPAIYYTGHCTGERQFEVMKEIMKSQLNSFSTGSIIQI